MFLILSIKYQLQSTVCIEKQKPVTIPAGVIFLFKTVLFPEHPLD